MLEFLKKKKCKIKKAQAKMEKLAKGKFYIVEEYRIESNMNPKYRDKKCTVYLCDYGYYHGDTFDEAIANLKKAMAERGEKL